jgi:hypothetical protein
MSGQVFQHPGKHQGAEIKSKPKPWICHYCGKKGHIRPFCFKLYGYPKQPLEPRNDSEIVKAKKEWKPNGDDTSLIAHTSFRPSSKEDLYFNSGCSRHMTGVEKFLVDIKSHSTSFVTFGDGAKGQIKGMGKLMGCLSLTMCYW